MRIQKFLAVSTSFNRKVFSLLFLYKTYFFFLFCAMSLDTFWKYATFTHPLEVSEIMKFICVQQLILRTYQGTLNSIFLVFSTNINLLFCAVWINVSSAVSSDCHLLSFRSPWNPSIHLINLAHNSLLSQLCASYM